MKQKILLIEDDLTFSATLARALKRRDYAVVTASNAAAALRAAETEHPDWVVLDLNLAGESGLALIAPLVAHLPEVRIVVLTGYASISTAVDAIKLGATQYLAKPVDVGSLLRAFESTILPARDGGHIPAPPAAPLSVERMEWEHIQRVLRENDGNISATARALKMHRRTLQRKLLRLPSKK